MAKKLERPWVLVVDTREQTPWSFESLTVGKGRRPVSIQTVTKKLDQGDYSIEGMEDQIAIERKSLSDLYSTVGQGRRRFVRELGRLNQLKWAAVLIESEWYNAMQNPPRRSKMSPSMIDGSINAWMQRFPNVHWLWRPGRFIASKVCYKILDRFWEDNSGE